MAKIIFAVMLSVIVFSIVLSTVYVDTHVVTLRILEDQLTSLAETLFEQNCAPGMTASGTDSQGHVVCEEIQS